MLLPELFAGVLMVMTVYEEERRRVERNMLALSNLNLATSSFVGGEIQKMLSQALDRVLNVVRIPAGALCLHYGDTQGTNFGGCDRTERRILRDHPSRELGRLRGEPGGAAGRLGGVARSGSRSSLGGAGPRSRIPEVRELLVAQGMRTVIGNQPASKGASVGRVIAGHTGYAAIYAGGTEIADGIGPPDRDGGGKLLPDPADRHGEARNCIS